VSKHTSRSCRSRDMRSGRSPFVPSHRVLHPWRDLDRPSERPHTGMCPPTVEQGGGVAAPARERCTASANEDRFPRVRTRQADPPCRETPFAHAAAPKCDTSSRVGGNCSSQSMVSPRGHPTRLLGHPGRARNRGCEELPFHVKRSEQRNSRPHRHFASLSLTQRRGPEM